MSASRAGRFNPVEKTLVTHWLGGWVGFQSQSGVVPKRKIPYPYQESDPGRPARSVVYILTELPQIWVMRSVSHYCVSYACYLAWTGVSWESCKMDLLLDLRFWSLLSLLGLLIPCPLRTKAHMARAGPHTYTLTVSVLSFVLCTMFTQYNWG